ncbi:MAG TPA: spore germination protein GerW family protein [Vicinamibacterales bacterium]|nr:spore germination protein GerW family protein [Vicinamibacterales bacterium]
MEHVENLLKTTLGEIERLLTTKTVVGEPIEVEGNTIIPLISIGFGFGAGGGTGKEAKKVETEGYGGGSGGGGGIRPVAIVVVDKNGVRLETIKKGAASVVEKAGEALGKIVEKQAAKKD